MKYKFIFVFILVMIISACSGSDNPTPSIKNPPIISLFQAVPDTIDPGQSSQLTWSITGATAVELSGFGQVGQVDSRNVTPADTTTYVLTAINADGATTKSVTVTVNKKANFVLLDNYQKLLNYGFCYLVFQLQNRGNGTAHDVRAMVTAYDFNNRILDASTGTYSGDVAPGGTVTFRFTFILITKWSRVGRLHFDWKWIDNTGLPFQQTETIPQ